MLLFDSWLTKDRTGFFSVCVFLGYDHVFEEFNKAGFQVSAYDQRGFGETGKEIKKGDEKRQEGGGLPPYFSMWIAVELTSFM
jgi:pimeloyl-ACP methyl ester carboxylesterase